MVLGGEEDGEGVSHNTFVGGVVCTKFIVNVCHL